MQQPSVTAVKTSRSPGGVGGGFPLTIFWLLSSFCSPTKGRTKIPRLGRGAGGVTIIENKHPEKQVSSLRDQLSKNNWQVIRQFSETSISAQSKESTKKRVRTLLRPLLVTLQSCAQKSKKIKSDSTTPRRVLAENEMNLRPRRWFCFRPEAAEVGGQSRLVFI